jgi:hypothetical protein
MSSADHRNVERVAAAPTAGGADPTGRPDDSPFGRGDAV